MNEEEKHKAVAQFKLQLNGTFNIFDMYGLGEHIPYVKEIVTELAIQLHKRLNGEKLPIDLGHAKRRYGQRRKR